MSMDTNTKLLSVLQSLYDLNPELVKAWCKRILADELQERARKGER